MDGVMVGRAAYHDPMSILAEADSRIFGDSSRAPLSPHQAARAMRPYIAAHVADGGKLAQVTRHMLGLFTGRPGARAWRRILSENSHKANAGLDVFDMALAAVPEQARQAAE